MNIKNGSDVSKNQDGYLYQFNTILEQILAEENIEH